ncbi:MAG: FAD:protein FMN transferase [Planctomycetota bacterium]
MILRQATFAMGTRFELVLAGEDGVRLRAAGEAALEEIEEQDRLLSLFHRSSLLARINRTAHATPVRLDADTFELFATALAVERDAGGAFDVTVAWRMRKEGFHPGSQLGPPPRAGAPRGRIALDPAARTVSFTTPGVAVDLGGIAKGHALDLAARALRAAGIRTALLHGGTSAAVAIGAPPGAPGWRVALPGRGAPVVVLRDAALSVSAARGRTRSDGAGHVLDPRTGGFAPTDLTTAVHAPSARLADAWSTALLAGARPATLDPAATAALGRAGAWTVAGASPVAFVLPPPREPALAISISCPPPTAGPS